MILEARAILDIGKIKIERLTERFRDIVRVRDFMELTCAASLAHHGFLGSVNRLELHYADLSQVPAQHLASLASCVTRFIKIENVSGCDLVSILNSLKCEELFIHRLRLGWDETRALVRAMESGVKKVTLWPEVKLDIEVLSEYSGKGQCTSLEQDTSLCQGLGPRYREELRNWARSRNWGIKTRGGYDIYYSKASGPSTEEFFNIHGILL